MFIGLVIIAVIAAILLVLIILAQNPKGGINNQLGASASIVGVKKTTDFLEKATWVLIGVVLATSVAATKLASGTSKSDIDPNIKAAQTGQPEAPQGGDKDFNLDDTTAAPAATDTVTK